MTKIEVLKAYASAWFGNSQQHSIHAQLLEARGLTKLAAKIQAEADEELAEAREVNRRLIELGETPVVAIDEYPVITDVREMLEYDCKDATDALPEMNGFLVSLTDDYITASMVQKFLIDEQAHLNWVKAHLCIIEQIGMENYLIQQMG